MQSFNSDASFYVKATIDDQLLLLDPTTKASKGKFGNASNKYGPFSSLSFFNHPNSIGLVAVGTVTGNLLLFSLDSASQKLLSADLHSSREITDVVFSDDGLSVFTCSSFDGIVNRISVKNGSNIAQYDAGTSGVAKLAYTSVSKLVKGSSKKGNKRGREMYEQVDEFLLTAGKDIRLFRALNGCLLAKFTGHATSISSLSFVYSHSHYLEGKVAFVSAAEDQFPSVWVHEFNSDVDPGPGLDVAFQRKPWTSLICENPVVSLSAHTTSPKATKNPDTTSTPLKKPKLNGSGSSTKKRKNGTPKLKGVNNGHQKSPGIHSRVIVCDEMKQSYAFDLDLTDPSPSPTQQSSFAIEAVGAEVVDVKLLEDRSISVAYQMILSKKQNGSSKSLPNLCFETIKVKPAFAQKKPALLRDFESFKEVSSKTKSNDAKAHMSNGNGVTEKVAAMEMESGNKRQVLHLEQHQLPTEAEKSSYSNELVLTTTDESTSLIHQAVNSGDTDLLTLCLDQSPSPIKTLSQLSEELSTNVSSIGNKAKMAKKLIISLVQVYLTAQAKPTLVLEWLRVALSLFSTLIIGDPLVSASLKRLYAAANVRLSKGEKLKRLHGKVVFLLDAKKGAATTGQKLLKNGGEKAPEQPMVLYKED